MGPSVEQSAALQHSRLTGLLRSTFGVDIDDTDVAALPFGLIAHRDDAAWALAWSEELGLLGGLGMWRRRLGVASVDLVVDHHAGIHARRAEIVEPAVRVWRLDGAVATRAEPEALESIAPADPDDLVLAARIKSAGADVVVEDGIVRAEVSGLEVARIVARDDGSAIEVGVGFYDRQAGVLLHGDRPPDDALRNVVELVKTHRRAGAPPHPLNRMARSRWMRAEIVSDPAAVGCPTIEPVEPIPPRHGLLDDGPSAGFDPGGRVLVVTSVGGEPSLLPVLAALLRRHDPLEIRVITPQRDTFAWFDAALDELPVPASLTGVTPPWDGNCEN